MTTIEEDMDEFFNFEDAAHHGADIDFTDFPSGPYDANLVFAEPQLDEDSFTCLQHFSASDEHEHLNLDLQMQDTTLMGPDDYTDFSRWLDGSSVPEEPCSYCRRMRIQCKVINEGLRKGSCTSCVALARSCSFTHEPARSQQKNNDQHRCAPVDFCLPGNTISSRSEASDTDLLDSPVDDARQACQQCEYCRSRGYKCKYMQENGRIGACKSCIALDRVCSLTPVDDEIGEWRLENPMYANNTWIPHNTPPLQSPVASSHSKSSPNLLSLLQSSEENMNFEASESSPKVGARFSRESVRILRGWLSTHHRHPYPTDEEKEGLQRQTGLNKTQITNWLANARRRGKVRAPRSTSPSVSNYSKAMDIPRRATPAQENMNPLEKWYHSPPENEPASVTAIAKAVKSSTWSSGRDSPSATSYGRSDDGSGRSLCNVSSTSSLGTSHSSGGSFASAFSHKSRGSFGSFGSFGNRGRRRRRRQAPKAVNVPKLGGPIRTYQCTFCTETFKTKHDWQRHEKSLHLSLERWICCPNGPNQFNGEYDQNQCVFCGLANPPSGHAEVHNYSSCADRSLEERTFYRKDHLRQHLNLVHDAKFQGFSMECWKAVTPEIRSRCGFCGVVMGSWTFRVDHLAEHFKGGKSMADWKGDWGFDPQVLDIVENGMPPCKYPILTDMWKEANTDCDIDLIHDERNSMEPYEASKEISSDSRTLEDLVKIGLGEYIHDRILSGGVPTDEELLKEARHIVQKSDEFMTSPGDIEVSWFRDLILLSGNNDYTDGKGMPSPETSNSWAKKLEMINTSAPYTSTHLAVIKCQKERALKCFVDTKQALGLTPTDSELQIEACRILDETESTSNFKSKGGLSWFKFLATASTKWLHKFRRRTSLPRTSEMAVEHIRSTDDRSIDYSIHNQVRLENEMVEWLKLQRAVGVTPTDAEIQRTARLIVYKTDDPWNQTVMDDPAILLLFKRQQGLANGNEDGPEMPTLSEAIELGIPQPYSAPSPKTLHWDLEPSGLGLPSPNLGSSGRNSATGTGAVTPNFDQPLYTTTQNQPSANSNPVMPLKYFLNDANCYGRLVRELSRFVTTCTSANNPNRHVRFLFILF